MSHGATDYGCNIGPDPKDARTAALLAENAELKGSVNSFAALTGQQHAEISGLKMLLQSSDDLRVNLASQLAAANRRIEGLKRYAHHHPGCKGRQYSNTPCDCGLSALLKGEGEK